MHALVHGAIRTVCRPSTRGLCNTGRGTLALKTRSFHQSLSSRKSIDSSRGKSLTNAEILTENADVNEVTGDDLEKPSSKPSSHHSYSRQKNNGAGSALKKSRSNSVQGLPPISLPEWFFQNNVHYRGSCEPVKLTGQFLVTELSVEDEKNAIKNSQLNVESEEKISSLQVKYNINHNVYTEILATLKAGLSLRPPKNSTTRTTLRPITVLQCQKDGASVYLDHIVSKLCVDLGADLVQLDAQDIAQIVGPYLDENIAWNNTTTSLYGYNAQKVAGKLEDLDDYRSSGDQDLEQSNQEVDENSTSSVVSSIGFSTSYTGEDFSKLLNVFVQKPRGNSKSTSWSQDESNQNNRNFDSTSSDRSKENIGQNPWDDLKTTAILRAIVESADSKRAAEIEGLGEDFSTSNEKISELTDMQNVVCCKPEIKTRPLIIQVKDYLELRSLDGGTELLQKLQKIVNKKWINGREIICVGTTEGVETVYEKRSIKILQEDIIGSEKRTILVPPDRKKSQDLQFKFDKKLRIRKINIRHLEDMILKLADGGESLPIVDLKENLDSAAVFASGMEEIVWNFGHIHRIAITMLGLPDLNQSVTNPKRYDGTCLSKALTVLLSSDEFKFAWGAEELKECQALTAQVSDEKKKSKLTYNTYEKKLLSGVVSPEKICSTFDDIHVPGEIIEALKTLTTLSLTRPEAFTYGILRRDRIPGILLYGPPGTGKTLLAKAVAKESGATVLEVTAADLNNMYVGEGEKNVKALFTLAKKLSPCVIFIDEVDSIFGSRESSRQRTSHREMINQFLREWDGISDFSGFIMVATNRPYDLDDAILRRLPRRLLIDLPLERDREAILKILLKDERLDSSVSLAKLAEATPFYSGSDLKNLCVAAALACVREENEMATAITASSKASQHLSAQINENKSGKRIIGYIDDGIMEEKTPVLHNNNHNQHEYPKTRLLTMTHFHKAIEEISASINEDMSSLKAIKKFDEKYGDRKGRRKKNISLGFGSSNSPIKDDIDSNLVRVRPMFDV
ncbi:putative mitochondrial aaa atpase [Erysiphe necator]|uniref:Putative mitochondrial aaa atpase n=1 Tax=Uncinula necator TaxID=52586 RepID=A0A0B1P8A2_UNCNE|nr:putative mitochondrial aaa atpase [Erysiphe necator]